MPKTAEPKKQTRSDRRRAETRARLLAAARELFAEQGVGATRTGDITGRADVGAGSLYNHFADKEEIVSALLGEIAEEQGALVDELTSEIEDPAAVVSYAHRHFVRLALRDRGFGQLVIRLDASHGLMRQILGPRAARDIQAGVESGRFDVDDVPAAVYLSGGALIGTIAGIVDRVNKKGVDEVHAAAVLRMLGLDKDDAAAVSTLPIDGGRRNG
jgi:AcrR family transcriptional regulator